MLFFRYRAPLLCRIEHAHCALHLNVVSRDYILRPHRACPLSLEVLERETGAIRISRYEKCEREIEKRKKRCSLCAKNQNRKVLENMKTVSKCACYFISLETPPSVVHKKIDSTRVRCQVSGSTAHPATCNIMLRSCYCSVGRKRPAAIQARSSACLRSSGRSMSAAAVAVRNGPVTTARRTAMPSFLLLKTSSMFRVCSFSTLTDEELRRKMDTFNDLFVTVGHSEVCAVKLGTVRLSCCCVAEDNRNHAFRQFLQRQRS